MMKRMLALLLCIALLVSAGLGESPFGMQNREDTEKVTTWSFYQAFQPGKLESWGNTQTTVYRPNQNELEAETGLSDPGMERMMGYSFTPLDVVLLIDTSGSMRATDSGGHEVMKLATEAAVDFVGTLFELSPSSRLAVMELNSMTVKDTFYGLSEENRMKSRINNMRAEGGTNTGDAFDSARELLSSSSRGDVRKMVVVLTDGYPEHGASDPIAYAQSACRQLSESSDDLLIYNIGLVGGMNAEQRNITRKVLHGVGETRYIEIDNAASAEGLLINEMDGMLSLRGNASSVMHWIFNTIVTAAASTTAGRTLSLLVDDDIDVFITDIWGTDYLCSSIGFQRINSGIGHFSYVGTGKNQKLVNLPDGEFVVVLRGRGNKRGSYSIFTSNGVELSTSTTARGSGAELDPGTADRYHIRNGEIIHRDRVTWNPLEHSAVDYFTGTISRGTEVTATGRVANKETVYAWTTKKAAAVTSLPKTSYVQVLARDPETGWYLVAAADKNGLLVRGWLPASAVAPSGYVPALIRDPAKTYSVIENVTAKTAPAETAVDGKKLKKGEKVTAIHAERDPSGTEWAYVKTGDKKEQAVYVPANSLENWESVSPAGFRIGYAMPILVWQNEFGGKGYTEFMWADSRNGGGTAVSGRTSATSGDFKTKNGSNNRDALAILLSPAGMIDRVNVLGGSGDYDSFHCILTAEDGYYVCGTTRSNDKDFAGIWDRSTFSGSSRSSTESTLALVGKLNPDLSVSWMKSFGAGARNHGFGFDQVVRLADGMIAAEGWLQGNHGFAMPTRGDQDFMVVKLTADGWLQNYASFGDERRDVPDSGIATADGGMILVGKNGKNSDKGMEAGQIFFVDASLSQTGRVTYGGNGVDVFDNVRDLGDGSYVVTGFSSSYSSSQDFWAIKIDGQGRMIWSRTYGGSGTEEVKGTLVLPNGNIVLLGSTTSIDGTVQGGTGNGVDAWAMCIDKDGQLLWQYTGGIAGDDWFNAAAVDPADGGIVLVGTCRNKSAKDAKGYAVKLLVP